MTQLNPDLDRVTASLAEIDGILSPSPQLRRSGGGLRLDGLGLPARRPSSKAGTAAPEAGPLTGAAE